MVWTRISKVYFIIRDSNYLLLYALLCLKHEHGIKTERMCRIVFYLQRMNTIADTHKNEVTFFFLTKKKKKEKTKK